MKNMRAQRSMKLPSYIHHEEPSNAGNVPSNRFGTEPSLELLLPGIISTRLVSEYSGYRPRTKLEPRHNERFAQSGTVTIQPEL
jgi:hypothetical protein